MSVYDISGNELNSVNDLNGLQTNVAYDIEGNQLLKPSKTLTAMSYNVQWFSNINSQQEMQTAIINKYKPDIIGFQEFSRGSSIPTVGQNALTDYPTIILSNHYNFIAMASKYDLEDITIHDFETQDVEGENEKRSYMKAYFNVDDKRICWINTHLCYRNISPKYGQMAEVFTMAEDEEYVIITGDFNSVGLSVDSADYIGLFKPFVDAGYNLANSSPKTRFVKTWGTSSKAQSVDDLIEPDDNIITSSNIKISSVIFDDTKFNYLDGHSIDHIAMITTLGIY